MFLRCKHEHHGSIVTQDFCFREALVSETKIQVVKSAAVPNQNPGLYVGAGSVMLW